MRDHRATDVAAAKPVAGGSTTTTTRPSAAVDPATAAAVTKAFETVFNGGGAVETRLASLAGRGPAPRVVHRPVRGPGDPGDRRPGARAHRLHERRRRRPRRRRVLDPAGPGRGARPPPRPGGAPGRDSGWSRGAPTARSPRSARPRSPRPAADATPRNLRSDLRKRRLLWVGRPRSRFAGGGGPSPEEGLPWAFRRPTRPGSCVQPAEVRNPPCSFRRPRASARKSARHGRQGQVDLRDLRGAARLPRVRTRHPGAARHLGRPQRARTPRAASAFAPADLARGRPEGGAREPPVDFAVAVARFLRVSSVADGDAA